MSDSDRLRQLAGMSPPNETATPGKLRLIGESIHQAIDWTQDTLQTTRPLAEQVLFHLLDEQKVIESAVGFVLQESKSDEETRQHMQGVKVHARAKGKVRGHRRSRIRIHRRWKKIIRPDLSPDVDVEEEATNDR
jgi:hypothetical protein